MNDFYCFQQTTEYNPYFDTVEKDNTVVVVEKEKVVKEELVKEEKITKKEKQLEENKLKSFY